MRTYQEIRKESQEKTNALMTECGVFWAFSNQQFVENKTPLKEGEKYVSIGAGGYMPKGNLQTLIDGEKAITKWEKAKEAKREHILYELNNHECFYTGDIDDAVNVLPYPRKDILKIFFEKREEYAQS